MQWQPRTLPKSWLRSKSFAGGMPRKGRKGIKWDKNKNLCSLPWYHLSEGNCVSGLGRHDFLRRRDPAVCTYKGTSTGWNFQYTRRTKPHGGLRGVINTTSVLCSYQPLLFIFPLALKWLGQKKDLDNLIVGQGCQTHFHQGPYQSCSCLQRAKCNLRTVQM